MLRENIFRRKDRIKDEFNQLNPLLKIKDNQRLNKRIKDKKKKKIIQKQ